MLRYLIKYCFIVMVLLLLQTCTKKNDFWLQYKPNITEIDPTEGYPESLITITGKGFSSIVEENKVTINNIEATVVEATTTELKVVVPEYATTGKIRIYIYYKDVLIDSAISTQDFNIYNNYIQTPIINNFLPTQANYNTLVQLSGKNFSNATPPNSDTPLVIIGVDTMQVKAFTDTSILFLIYKPLPIGEYVVSIIKKNRNDNNKPLRGFSKTNLAIVASALLLKESDVMIGDSLHIMGKGLLSAMNVFLSIDNNKVLCPITRIHDSLLVGKISNDIFQYINPKTSNVFNVSVLFNNHQTLSAGSVRVSIASNNLVYLKSTSTNNNQDVSVIYSKNNKIINPIKATLYLNLNNIAVAESVNNNTTTIDSIITFSSSILKNILGVNEDSKIVQAEIKILTADGNETTYFLGNITVNAVPVYNTPFIVPNNLKANDVVTATGTHIIPDVNLYQLIGFPNGKVISATSATSTAITFKIPTDIPAGIYSKIKLKIGTNTDTKDNSFSIIPTITNITPLSGGDSTILTITGYNLYTKNKIYFDTISINKFDSIVSPYNSLKDTISSKNLVGNTTYVVGIGDSNSIAPMVTSSQIFLYTISQFKIFTNNTANSTTATDGDSIKVSGKSIQGKNIILKYNNIQLSLSTVKNNDTLKTKIVESDIASLNIPDNATNVQAQVYIELTNGSLILAGSLMIKPTPIITGINPNTGSTVKYNDLITITGKHLSNNLGDFELKLKNDSIPLTSGNGSSIQFRIPENIESNIDSVIIKMLGKDLQQDKLHHYLKIIPTITSISPTNGNNNTKITIQGYNFGNTNNTLKIDSFATITNIVSSNRFQTITFTIGNNTLNIGDSYPITLTTNGLTATSSQNFTYTLGGGITITSNNTNHTILEAGNNLIINGTNLKGISMIVLKYGNASFSIPANTNSGTLINTNPITQALIQSLNIPDNKVSDVVQVYLETGSTQTLAGSIIVKPTAEITGINPNIGSIVKYNDLITITGKHLSNNLGDFAIKLGTNTIPITLANGSNIQFRIPGNIASKDDSIYIKMLGNDLQQDKLHNYLKIAPSITSISPTSGTNNTLFTIQGYNFDTLNTIYFGNQKPINTISSSNSFQTISFSIPDSIQLQAGVSYPIKVKTDIDSVVSSTAFAYTLGGSITIKTDNPEPTILSENNLLKINGINLIGINNIVLKYGAASLLLPVTLTGNELTTTIISVANIQSLNIPDNKASDVVEVYLQTGATQTLAGSIIVKPTPKITGINPNNGSIVKGNDIITITGKHLSSNLGDFNIQLDSTSIPATLANGNSIQFKIPGNIECGTDSVYMKINNVDMQQGTLHYHIKIVPTITSISPTTGTNGSLLTIQGYNFGSKDTIVIDTNNISTISSNLETITFTLPNSNNLQHGISYPIKLKTNGSSIIATNLFTYNLTNNFSISSNNTNDSAIVVATNTINIYGTNLTGINSIVLKYGSASINIASAVNLGNKITTIPISHNIIQSLNIPDNKASDVVQVYLQTGSTQTLAGSIIVKPTPKITGINPNNGSIVKGNDVITITGKHLSSNLGDFEIKLGTTNIIPLTVANGISIQFKIPTNIVAIDDSIYINMNNVDLQKDTIHYHLNIMPTITSISPTNGSDNTILTIQGYNFSSNINTLYIGNDSFPNIPSTNNFKTIIFTIPSAHQLQAESIYPIKVRSNQFYTTATQTFTYTSNFNIINVQTLYIDTSHVRVSGTGLKNTTLYLRYNNGAFLPIGGIASSTLIESDPIGKNTVNLLGIPTNVSSATVGVYVLAGSTYTFVGNINIKAMPKLYTFSSKPAFLGGNTLSIRGDHITTTDNYRIGLSRILGDTVWFAPTSLNTTTLNLTVSDTLTASMYEVVIKYPNTDKDTIMSLDTIIIKPTISSILPNSNIDTATTFTIIGKNLSANKSEIITLLNGVDNSTNFSVENATQTSVTILYKSSGSPLNGIGMGTYPLSLKINGRISSPVNISLKR